MGAFTALAKLDPLRVDRRASRLQVLRQSHEGGEALVSWRVRRRGSGKRRFRSWWARQQWQTFPSGASLKPCTALQKLRQCACGGSSVAFAFQQRLASDAIMGSRQQDLATDGTDFTDRILPLCHPWDYS